LEAAAAQRPTENPKSIMKGYTNSSSYKSHMKPYIQDPVYVCPAHNNTINDSIKFGDIQNSGQNGREGSDGGSTEDQDPDVMQQLMSAQHSINNAMTIMNSNRERAKKQLQSLETIRKSEINEFANSGWEMIRIVVDSGASETVVPRDLCPMIQTRESVGSRDKQEYRAANGYTILNEGKKEISVLAQHGQQRRLVMQVCDVTKPLMSVSKSNAQGNIFVFDGDNSYMQCKKTGETTRIREEGGVFVLYAYVRPFTGPE
jgi:hypothetical protein